MGLKSQHYSKSIKVIIFSRGLGIGHVKRDLEIIKELKKRIKITEGYVLFVWFRLRILTYERS
jgi:predicted glycosyltransferase